MVRKKRYHQETRRLRVYEQWQGNERFFCYGFCVTGPSWKSGLGSLALLIAPTVVFLVWVAPYMAQHVTPAILVISCVLPVVCVSMLLLTSCRDPGILPRQEPDEEWLQARKPRTKDLCVNGQRVTVRYNDTCHFYQPPRAHHCSVNDNCIERFDHHCPWVGTTIGKRNYRTFLLFIYATSVFIAWTFGVSLGSLFVKHGQLVEAAAAAAGTGAGGRGGGSDGPPATDALSSNLWLQTLGQSGPALALMIFSFIFFWFVAGLSGFHTWLVATNQTTYENFRYNHNQVPNPYSEGLLRNCASVWCVRIPPSKVQFRAYLDEVVRRPVELGWPEWSPPAPMYLHHTNQQAPSPPPPMQQQQHSASASAASGMTSPLGGSGGASGGSSGGPLGGGGDSRAAGMGLAAGAAGVGAGVAAAAAAAGSWGSSDALSSSQVSATQQQQQQQQQQQYGSPYTTADGGVQGRSVEGSAGGQGATAGAAHANGVHDMPHHQHLAQQQQQRELELQQLPPAAAAGGQSFDSQPDSSPLQQQLHRATTQGYTHASPPQLRQPTAGPASPPVPAAAGAAAAAAATAGAAPAAAAASAAAHPAAVAIEVADSGSSSPYQTPLGVAPASAGVRSPQQQQQQQQQPPQQQPLRVLQAQHASAGGGSSGPMSPLAPAAAPQVGTGVRRASPTAGGTAETPTGGS